ncbi:MAG: hypothetical protein HYV75_09965 [Opitutae bacterium]|nr:hypothetical protein [Opitutae bacterium]
MAGLPLAVLTVPTLVQAHCDSLDGPVIQTAKAALAKGDVTSVLMWVKAGDEATVRSVFAQTLEVRKLSPAAADLADTYFFETLVRIHRAGEGEPFAGLKPAGSAEPALVAADQALEKGSVTGLADGLQQRVAAGLKLRFDRAKEAKEHAAHNVAAGRAYVAAYVDFIHYYENLQTAAERPAGHGAEHQH